MTEINPDSQVKIFRLLIEFENRSEQIEGIIAHIKHLFVTNSGQISIPDAVGTIHELRWHLEKTTSQIDSFLELLGIQRRPPTPAGSTGAGQDAKASASERQHPHDLRGSTKNLSIPALMQLLSSQKKTGTLWIKSAEKERYIFELLDGSVVHAATDTPIPEHRLGTILVAKDRLSTEKLEEFLERYDPSAGKIGLALTREKLVTESDLRDALEHQIQELFQRIASHERAVFCFREGPVSDIELRACLNTSRLLDGVTQVPDGATEKPKLAPDEPDLELPDPTEPDPVGEPELLTDSELVEDPEPVAETLAAEPEPVAEPEPTAEAEPVAEPEPAAEAEPVAEPEPEVPDHANETGDPTAEDPGFHTTTNFGMVSFDGADSAETNDNIAAIDDLLTKISNSSHPNTPESAITDDAAEECDSSGRRSLRSTKKQPRDD